MIKTDGGSYNGSWKLGKKEGYGHEISAKSGIEYRG